MRTAVTTISGRMRTPFLFLLFLFIIQSIQGQQLENLLRELPDVTFREVESKSPFVKTFELKIKQPLCRLLKMKILYGSLWKTNIMAARELPI